MVPKGVFKDQKTVKAIDITCNDLFARYIRTASQLSKGLAGTYAETLMEFLDYLQFLANRRCRFSDQGIILFDDEYRRFADLDQLSLADASSRFAIADDELNEESRRFRNYRAQRSSRTGNYDNRLFRGAGSQNIGPSKDPPFRYPVCIDFNRTDCKFATKCKFPHACGYCNGNHRARNCGNQQNGQQQ